jgi:hypothetical protein
MTIAYDRDVGQKFDLDGTRTRGLLARVLRMVCGADFASHRASQE